jgi:hypothetical protein
MKTTLLIQDNIQQVVFTPENEHEKQLLLLINKADVETTIKVGSFSSCQGGWVRYYEPAYYNPHKEDITSLMLVLKPKENKD